MTFIYMGVDDLDNFVATCPLGLQCAELSHVARCDLKCDNSYRRGKNFWSVDF